MKQFVNPEIEIIKFQMEDIITNSNYELPIAPISEVSEDECDMVPLG